jgi:thiamine pyrophosphate-dependent acetolactate synthase large subunit-like protein
MRRYECLEILADVVGDDALVISNVARTSFEWHMVHPSEGNLYTMAMGMVTPVAHGLALALPHRRVVALDGDGGMLLNLGALATIGNTAPPNLLVIIFDNAAYASTGGLPTATAGRTDLAAVARGAGIDGATRVDNLDDFRHALGTALDAPGPWVIVARVVNEKPPVKPKLMDGRENKYRFVRHIEKTEGKVILKPSVVGREGA